MALIGLAESVGPLRGVVRGADDDAVAQPVDDRLVAQSLAQRQLIVESGRVALDNDSWLAKESGRRQRGGVQTDVAGSLASVFCFSQDAEISGFIGVVVQPYIGFTVSLRRQQGTVLKTFLNKPFGRLAARQGEHRGRRLLHFAFRQAKIGRPVADGIEQNRVFGLSVADDVGFAVEREPALIAAQPSLRVGRPSDVAALRGMITAVDHRDRSPLLAEEGLAVVAADVEVAVLEARAAAEGAPQRLGAVEVEVAVAVDGVAAVQGVVGALKVASFVETFAGAVERVQVEPADEAHVAGRQQSAVDIADVGLRDGVAAAPD